MKLKYMIPALCICTCTAMPEMLHAQDDSLKKDSTERPFNAMDYVLQKRYIPQGREVNNSQPGKNFSLSVMGGVNKLRGSSSLPAWFNGGIVDDLLVYRYEQEKYLLVVNASNIEKDWNWCMSHNTMGAELENASDRMAQLAVQGPKAIEALQKLTPVNLSELSYYTFTHGEFAGEPDVIISNTGYTGAGGFELYFYPEAAIKIWNAVFEAGAEFGIKPIGLGARDTLRLEMGFCLYGNDLDDTTSPIEAGLGWITKFVEGKNFINRPMLEKQKTEGTVRKLVGFEMVDRGIPRHGYELQNPEGTTRK